MRKMLPMTLITLALLVLLTACAAEGERAPENSPGPEAEAAPVAEPSPEASVFRLVGAKAEIVVGSTKIHGAAYYAGEGEDTMVLPLVEVAKAMGWSVDEGVASAGPSEIKLTRGGADDVLIAFERPEAEVRGQVDGVSVEKSGKQADVSRQPTPYLDGTLYVTEAFLDAALQEVDVRYDGETKITIEARA